MPITFPKHSSKRNCGQCRKAHMVMLAQYFKGSIFFLNAGYSARLWKSSARKNRPRKPEPEGPEQGTTPLPGFGRAI
ncbi:hypothetical protein [Devosia honganensis]|uniref:hypothetical protein n=1 Tax=Devosia honganensis TaxID=1610527 RepID=UPI0036D37561